MDTTYRLRYLLYLAAFMLAMSLCYVYAEPAPPRQESHLLFQVTPQHAGFLAAAESEPAFDPAALRAASVPVISPQLLEQLEQNAHSHRSFLHRSHRAAIPASLPSLAPIFGLNAQTASTH